MVALTTKHTVVEKMQCFLYSDNFGIFLELTVTAGKLLNGLVLTSSNLHVTCAWTLFKFALSGCSVMLQVSVSKLVNFRFASKFPLTHLLLHKPGLSVYERRFVMCKADYLFPALTSHRTHVPTATTETQKYCNTYTDFACKMLWQQICGLSYCRSFSCWKNWWKPKAHFLTRRRRLWTCRMSYVTGTRWDAQKKCTRHIKTLKFELL